MHVLCAHHLFTPSLRRYLMTCDPMGNCAPWSTTDHTKRWDACQAANIAAQSDQQKREVDALNVRSAALTDEVASDKVRLQ